MSVSDKMPEFNADQFGARLREALARGSMDVKALQEAVKARTRGAGGSSYGSIWSYVNGKAPQEPRREVVEAIADVLGFSAEELRFGSPAAAPANDEGAGSFRRWKEEVRECLRPIVE